MNKNVVIVVVVVLALLAALVYWKWDSMPFMGGQNAGMNKSQMQGPCAEDAREKVQEIETENLADQEAQGLM